MPRNAWMALTFIVLLITGGLQVQCLKNVKLEMDPEVVEYGNQVLLRCRYELEGALLYSLKWYRGTFEFYRYSPGETSPIKIFNFTWIQVDQENSNESQVTLINVGFQLSGNFSCEVTTDAPTFTTASSSRSLTVISVPKGKPVMISEKPRYEPGEKLKANCSMAPSRPPLNLTFTLNGVQVDEYVTTSYGHDSNSVQALDDDEDFVIANQWAEIDLDLQPYHFVGGQLNLRCTAKIPGISFEKLSELQLGSVKEPVPARVTSSEKTRTHHHKMADPLILGLTLLTFYLR